MRSMPTLCAGRVRSRGVEAMFPDLHRRSHGEESLALIESRMTGDGLCLLDESESALSW